MQHRRVSPLPVAVLATVSLLLGAFAAWTEARGDTTAPANTPTAVPAPAPAPTASVPPTRAPQPVPTRPRVTRCGASAPAPTLEPVPQDLLDAFAVLRRERAERDTLPDAALKALRARDLEPFDPAAARELRTTADGGHAWVVPVRDAGAGGWPVLCPPQAAPVRPRVVRPSRTPRSTKTGPRVEAPPAVVYAPAAPLPTRPRSTTPRPGLAVVALGGAPAGGGGTLADLVRGRAAVTTDPCSGPGADMLTVSGIVPDGVAAAFLTAQDGTAVRADVQDNAYAFVVPRPKAPEQRYVVWTGGDGTPHVQPLRTLMLPARLRCANVPASVARVSPEPGAACGGGVATNVVLAAPVPRPVRRTKGGRAVPLPGPAPVVPPVVALSAPALCATTIYRLPATVPAIPKRTP